jgi:hypothetical protein
MVLHSQYVNYNNNEIIKVKENCKLGQYVILPCNMIECVVVSYILITISFLLIILLLKINLEGKSDSTLSM